MSHQSTARHRAPQRVRTPFTPVTGAVTDRVGQVGRGGALVILSSGLVAGGGIALANTDLLRPGAAADNLALRLAPGPAGGTGVAGAAGAADGGNAPAERAATGDEPVAAPATAVVTFDRTVFQPVPRVVSQPATGGTTATERTATERTATGTTATGTTATARPARSGRTAAASRSERRTPSTKATARPAAAVPSARSTTPAETPAPSGSGSGSAAIAIAVRYLGVPYVYGGTTPRGFDCSGFVQYVYAQLGISLPRTADDQMNATRRIPRSEARPGDLVSFVSGGVAYHIGIYAGDGQLYDAPKPGGVVSKRAIWSAAVVFTRVTG